MLNVKRNQTFLPNFSLKKKSPPYPQPPLSPLIKGAMGLFKGDEGRGVVSKEIIGIKSSIIRNTKE
jgi:hypothetical protein